MQYPREFTAESRNRIEAERLKASRELDERRKLVPWSKWGPSEVDEANLHKYILRVFLAFAKEACNLCSRGSWTLDRVRREAEDVHLRQFAIEAYSESGNDKNGRKLREITSNWNGSIFPEVKRKLQESPEWKQYEDELLAAAEAVRTKGAERAQPVIPSQEPDGQLVFTPSDDYVLIEYGGAKYTLTPLAGKIVKVLDEAHRAGKVGVGRADIQHKIKCGRVWDAFRRRDGERFWRHFIKKIEKDVYALDLKHSPES